MRSYLLFVMMIAILLALTAACAPPAPDSLQPTPTLNLANPASAYCEEQGHKLEIRKDDQGNEQGFCIFEDGSECEEWAFFRGECGMDQANKLSLNIVEAAGLQSTQKIILSSFNINSADADTPEQPRMPGPKVLLEITDPDQIEALIAPLNQTLPLVTPMRCPPFYILAFQLKTNDTTEISLGYCGLRGSEPYWHDKALRPPDDFTKRFNALLADAGIPQR